MSVPIRFSAVGSWIGRCLVMAGVLVVWPDVACGQDVFAGSELLWKIPLGDHQYTIPRVDGDRIFIGTNDTNIDHPAAQSTGGGILMCLDRASGTLIWRLPIPRYMQGINPPFHFDQWTCGICSCPAVDGDRLYVAGPRGDVLCLDREGQANGNDGPFVAEKTYMGIAADSDYNLAPTDGDIVWRFDMIGQLGVVPHDVCGDSPAMKTIHSPSLDHWASPTAPNDGKGTSRGAPPSPSITWRRSFAAKAMRDPPAAKEFCI